MATITEVDDDTVEQAPTPETAPVAPSTAMPEPGPQRSSQIAN